LVTEAELGSGAGLEKQWSLPNPGELTLAGLPLRHQNPAPSLRQTLGIRECRRVDAASLWTDLRLRITVLRYYIANWSADMAMSVRLDPTLETRVAQESRRLGITKSEFVKDALERVLGLKNPADLLSTVRSGKAMGNPQASRNVSARMKAKLRAKLPD
jgi:predicted DNA-binding protein